MVYWGCGTARNRCAWVLCVGIAVAGTAVFCAGAGHMWVCNHQPGSSSSRFGGFGDAPGSCKLQAGVMMAVGPLVVGLGVAPCLLFFASCMAVPPPPPVDWAEVRVDALRVAHPGSAWACRRTEPDHRCC
jgi:hypothetical protein